MNFPKRKKSKDNPYTIKYSEEKKSYYLTFKYNKKNQNVIISNEIFEQFNKFELEDISQMHKFDKYIEHSEIYEETLYKKSLNFEETIEEIVIKKDDFIRLKKAINQLNHLQKRRVIMYYFCDMTLEKISKIENCSVQAVDKNIKQSLERLKDILNDKNFK